MVDLDFPINSFGDNSEYLNTSRTLLFVTFELLRVNISNKKIPFRKTKYCPAKDKYKSLHRSILSLH